MKRRTVIEQEKFEALINDVRNRIAPEAVIRAARAEGFREGTEAMRAALIAEAERLGIGVTVRFLRDSVLPEMPK